MLSVVKFISVYYAQNLLVDSHVYIQYKLRVVFMLSLMKFIIVYYVQTLFVDSNVYI